MLITAPEESKDHEPWGFGRKEATEEKKEVKRGNKKVKSGSCEWKENNRQGDRRGNRREKK